MLLSQTLLEVLNEAKETGDYDEFVKERNLEEKEYIFM